MLLVPRATTAPFAVALAVATGIVTATGIGGPRSSRACSHRWTVRGEEWARALRSLQRHPHIWQGRVDAVLIDRLVAIADGRAGAIEQLTLL